MDDSDGDDAALLAAASACDAEVALLLLRSRFPPAGAWPALGACAPSGGSPALPPGALLPAPIMLRSSLCSLMGHHLLKGEAGRRAVLALELQLDTLARSRTLRRLPLPGLRERTVLIFESDYRAAVARAASASASPGDAAALAAFAERALPSLASGRTSRAEVAELLAAGGGGRERGGETSSAAEASDAAAASAVAALLRAGFLARCASTEAGAGAGALVLTLPGLGAFRSHLASGVGALVARLARRPGRREERRRVEGARLGARGGPLPAALLVAHALGRGSLVVAYSHPPPRGDVLGLPSGGGGGGGDDDG